MGNSRVCAEGDEAMERGLGGYLKGCPERWHTTKVSITEGWDWPVEKLRAIIIWRWSHPAGLELAHS